MKRRTIPLTHSFSNTQIGYMELVMEDEDASIMLNDTILAQMVFAPAYQTNEDGTIEVIEFSLIPAQNAVGLINKGIEEANENI